MDNLSAIVIGAVTAAIGTILATKLLNSAPIGGAEPRHIRSVSPTTRSGYLSVTVPARTSRDASPVVQNTPITEAAYNQHPVRYQVAVGPLQNQPNQEAILPI